MARVLVISSEVVRGYVGGSCARAALQTLGIEAWVLPTVMLSNHPGHLVTGGSRCDPALLLRMLDALAANGWLAEVDAILTGYLPSPEHVAFAELAVRRLRQSNPTLPYLCDTVLGDHPKGLYIDPMAAVAVRDRLLPLADVITPNRFELSWLTGASATDDLAAVDRMARGLGVPSVVVTSVAAADPRFLFNLLSTREQAVAARVTHRAAAPHGTGDLIAALIAGQLAQRRRLVDAFCFAVAAVDDAVERCQGEDALRLAATGNRWQQLAPWPIEPVRSTDGGGQPRKGGR